MPTYIFERFVNHKIKIRRTKLWKSQRCFVQYPITVQKGIKDTIFTKPINVLPVKLKAIA